MYTIDFDIVNSTCLEYGRRRIVVRSSDATTLTWLEEFLCPAFRTIDCEHADWTVTLETDSPLYSELVQRPPSSHTESIDCFTLDGHFQKHELQQSVGHCLIACDRKRVIFYVVDRLNCVVRILAPVDGFRCRMPLARVVRELATVHSMSAGQLHCHGAAFAIGNQAIVLAGVKCSGKTSALIHSLYQPTTRFITNDRLFVQCDEDRLLVRGMPTIFRIRPKTLDLLPAFGRRYRTHPYDYRETLKESEQKFPARRKRLFGKRDLATRLTVSQFCGLMDVSAIGEAPLGAIVFPHVTPDVKSVHIERCPPQVAANKLFNESLLAASSPQCTAGLFRKADEPSVLSDETIRRQCERIAFQVPSYTCEIGATAYQRPFLFDLLQCKAA